MPRVWSLPLTNRLHSFNNLYLKNSDGTQEEKSVVYGASTNGRMTGLETGNTFCTPKTGTYGSRLFRS